MDDGTAEESLIAQITGTTFAKQIAEVSRHVFTGVRCKIAKIEGQPWHEIHRAKRTALQKTVISEPTLMSPSAQFRMSPSTMSPSLVETPPGWKTVGDVETSTCWMELINNHEDPVTMKELIQANLKTMFPIIQCINNKNITNPEN